MSAPGVHYPHRIRLRGPWDCIPLRDQVAPLRMTIPCRWGEGGLPGFAGVVRFVRRFGYPGQIDAQERVWLTFAGIEGSADITLNGHSFGRHPNGGPLEFEISPLLGSRNELIVEIEAPGDRGGLWGEVALEIRRTAFLSEVRAVREGEGVSVVGEVVGTAERPLELYVLSRGASPEYKLVPAGQSFTIFAETTASQVRVELVDGATVWYVVEVAVEQTPWEARGS